MTKNTVRLVTWNINSVRKRVNLAHQIIATYKPDILCLQEIKCTEDQFPFEAFTELGLNHIALHGQKGYHGVATLSKFALETMAYHNFDNTGEARDLGVIIKEGFLSNTELYNLYVPAGGYIANPIKNPKFQQKLDYVAAMKTWGRDLPSRETGRIVVGDLNIAPLVTDVYSHEKLKNVVSHTEVERQAFTEAMESGHWFDAVRQIIPPDEKLFSWWTYREKDWQSVNRGRRLDHVWVNEPLLDHITSCSIEREVRGWEEPSDHVPVIVDFAFNQR